MKLKVFLTFLIIFFNFNTCFALTLANKNMYFEKNCSYLMSFDEKILHYNLENTAAAKVEILSSIFNDRHELLIKPVENINTRLSVWTENNTYHFYISVIKPLAVQDNSKKEKSVPYNFEIDKPPYVSAQGNIFSFKLDEPPRVR
ncbi:MAG: hypothetical protein ACD_20C00162G0008 [uncultured bacterium]|nr:MAG: hypothetical protein ACD_20C00162G0008 [uncultured bacterium]